MAKKYYLSESDRRKVGDVIKRVNGGTGVPSRRPVPQRRRNRGGGNAIADMAYGTVSAYDATNKVITASGSPDALPTGTPAIPAGVKVFDRENAGFSVSASFYAIRSVNVHTDGTHGQVDWVVFPTSAGSVNAYNVQLYNNSKALTDTSVDVKLLDASLAAVGTELLCYDPHGKFSSAQSQTAKGQAQLVRDADTGNTRLEFIHLEGPAEYICATLTEDVGETTSDVASATVNSYWGSDWNTADPGSTATVESCNGLHDSLVDGDKVIARLKDPDADPVEYVIVESLAGLTARTQYAVVTSAAGAGTWSGSASFDFRACPGSVGKCVLLRELGEPPTYPTAWAPSTAYSADEEFSAAVGGGLTDPEDINSNPLIPGETYTMSYPTGQTSGASLDVPEFAKMQTHARQHGSGNAGCLSVPVLGEGEDMTDYELNLETIYDEVGLSVGKVIKISNTSGAGIPPGPFGEGEAPTVKGEFLQPTDYLRLLSGFGAEKYLYSTDGDAISWYAGDVDELACTTITYVTSVDCTDNVLSYETDTIDVLECEA